LFEASDSAVKNCTVRTVCCLTESEKIVLVSDTRVRGYKPCQSRRIFHVENILSTPSFRAELKPLFTCCSFAACKRTLQLRGARHYRQYSRSVLAFLFLISLPDISKFGEDVGIIGGVSGNVED
jgi:hypothetical protein